MKSCRFKSVLLVLILCFLFSACTTKQPTQVNEQNHDNVDVVVVKFGAALDPTDSYLEKIEKETGETIQDNRWTRHFEEELNVKIEFELLAAGDIYTQKINLAIASGKLPHAIYCNDLNTVKQLAEADKIWDIGPIYDQFASPLLKSIVEGETKRVFDPVTYDGKIYGLPYKMPSTNGYNHLWIRKDWLENLKLDAPRNMQDVYNIAKAFTNDDPDGNEINDTFGLQMENGFLDTMRGFFWAFDAYPSHWIKDENNKIVYGTVQPAMKDALLMLKNMLSEGLLDPEFGSKSYGKAMELVASGKVGMFYGPHWAAFLAYKAIENNPKADWMVVPLPTQDNKQIKIPLTITSNGYELISKDFKHPELIIKMFNLYVDKLFGENNEFDEYFSPDGLDNVWQMGPLYTLDSNIDVGSFRNIKNAIINNTTDDLKGTAKGYYKTMQEGDWAMGMMFGPENTPFAFVDSTYPNQIIWNEYFGSPTPTMQKRWSSMEELLIVTLTKIIQGTEDINSFESMVKQWGELGGDSVVNEVNMKN